MVYTIYSKGRERELRTGGREKRLEATMAAAPAVPTTEMVAAVPMTSETVTPAIPLEAVQTVNKLDIARPVLTGDGACARANTCRSVTV